MDKSRNKILLFFITLLTFAFVGCKKEVKRIDSERFLFGTYLKVAVLSDNEKEAKKIQESVYEVIEDIDLKYNSKNEESLISQLNRDGKVKLDTEGLTLLGKVREGYELSNKKYDITMAPLMEVWGFSEDVLPRTELPTEEELEKAVSKVDFSKVKFIENEVTIEDGMMLDTGSFLKGYAIEKAKKVMEEKGVQGGLISSLSSIAAIGEKTDGSPWRVGVQNPNNPEELLGIVELRNQSMGVSGDYQTYIEIDGKRYHHIIDKETKYPVDDKKMVVVVNDNSLEADLYSTVFFLMPVEKVLEFVENKENLEVLIVDKNNEIHMSKDMKFIEK